MRRRIKNIGSYVLLIVVVTKLSVVQAEEIVFNIDNSLNQVMMIFLGIFLILGILLMLVIFKMLAGKKRGNELNCELTDEEIKKMDANLTRLTLKEEVFSLYKKLETAKTKQNYDTLKELLSDELYLLEEQSLKKMKEKKQKLVATNIHMKDARILSLKKGKNGIKAEFYLYVSQYDYIVDKQKQVVRGTDKAEYQIEYKLTLEQNLEKHFVITKMECIGKWIKN